MPSKHVYTSNDMSAAELQAIIDDAVPGTTIHLEAGEYYLDDPLHIDRSDIAIIGAGSDQTTLIVDPKLASVPAIQLGHDVFEPEILDTLTIRQTARKGDDTIVVEGAHGLEEGDYLYITQENTDAFFDEIGDTAWRKDKDLRTILVKVEEVDGAEIELDRDLPFDFDPAITTVEHRHILEDNVLSGFTLKGSWGDADPGRFANTLRTENGATMLLASGTSGAELSDIVVEGAASHGITLASSTDLTATDLSILGAHDKGSSGNGYGIWVRDVYDSEISADRILDTRHAVVFASYTSAIGNEIEVNETNRDINFHGGRDQDNSVSVVSSVRSGDEIRYMSPTLFFNDGTSYGAPTDHAANKVAFTTVSGTVRTDVIEAADTGAYIELHGGSDVARTGAGNDYVNLGTGADTVYASAGYDEYLGGAGEDTIIFDAAQSDLSTAWSGETLIVTSSQGQIRASGFEQAIFSDGAVDFRDIVAKIVRGPLWVEKGPGVAQVATGDERWERATITETTVMGADLDGVLVRTSADIDVFGNALDNNILGNNGDNRVEAGAGDDRVFGRAGDDVIFGGDGDDFLHGAAGDDTLIGGDGEDNLKGGMGADLFVATGGQNKVLDFDASEGDRIVFNSSTEDDLQDAVLTYLETGQSIGGYVFDQTREDGAIHTRITLDRDESITLVNTSLDDLAF